MSVRIGRAFQRDVNYVKSELSGMYSELRAAKVSSAPAHRTQSLKCSRCSNRNTEALILAFDLGVMETHF